MVRTGMVLAAAAGIYLLAVKPRLGSRADRMKGVYYAHRGLHNKKAGVPENTLAAFGKAVNAGYGIELDVRLTKDDEAVVFHDPRLRRMCSVEGNVEDFTYEELQQFSILGTEERIPRFRDVLELVDGRVPLLVEIKSEDFQTKVCEKADELLCRYHGEYVIESFHPWVLLWYRRHRPEVCRGQLSMNFHRQEGDFHPAKFLIQHLMLNFIGRPDFIAYDIRARKGVSKGICRKLFGTPCAAWTIRSPKQLSTARPYFDTFIFEGFFPANKGI